MTKIAVGLVLFLGVLGASPAEAAMCGGDMWGSRSSFVGMAGDRIAQIHASTNVNHLSNHNGCQGTFSSKATLTKMGSGPGVSCATGTTTKTHQSDGANTSTSSVLNCSGLAYNVPYGAMGTHNGFGTTAHTSQSSSTVMWVFEDADGDGYSVQDGDCNDNNADIYPGRTLSCSDMSQEDKNCNGQRDIEELGPTCENCPLIISLEGNAIHLTNPEAGVWFDLNADGNPEKLSWTLVLEPARYTIQIFRKVILTQTMNAGESRIPGIPRMRGTLFAVIPYSLMEGDIELELEDGRRWKCALTSTDGSLASRGEFG